MRPVIPMLYSGIYSANASLWAILGAAASAERVLQTRTVEKWGLTDGGSVVEFRGRETLKSEQLHGRIRHVRVVDWAATGRRGHVGAAARKSRRGREQRVASPSLLNARHGLGLDHPAVARQRPAPLSPASARFPACPGRVTPQRLPELSTVPVCRSPMICSTWRAS